MQFAREDPRGHKTEIKTYVQTHDHIIGARATILPFNCNDVCLTHNRFKECEEDDWFRAATMLAITLVVLQYNQFYNKHIIGCAH